MDAWHGVAVAGGCLDLRAKRVEQDLVSQDVPMLGVAGWVDGIQSSDRRRNVRDEVVVTRHAAAFVNVLTKAFKPHGATLNGTTLGELHG